MEIITFHYSYKKLLLKWKTMKNSLCNLCNIVEDYSHYFRTCIFFKDFWRKIKELLKKSGIENDITLYIILYSVIKYSIKVIMTSIIFLHSLDFQYIRHITFQSKKLKGLMFTHCLLGEYLQIYRGNEIIQKSSFLKR
jgi:hypothetical protein